MCGGMPITNTLLATSNRLSARQLSCTATSSIGLEEGRYPSKRSLPPINRTMVLSLPGSGIKLTTSLIPAPGAIEYIRWGSQVVSVVSHQ